ncbi:hypothetical protein CLOM_g17341 [Closterium sp. NIES-68]|nr:hypothetical protein CLOM_g17341 [Closterium sp. NIES-68]GJP73164.1 hypothetical protein CLOP_g3901 [Closterium sp. NIES-67]
MAQDTPSPGLSEAGGGQGEGAGEGRGTHARMGADGCFVLRTGAAMPAIGLGTWLEGDGGEQTQEAVRVALQCGYRSIDCAHLYGTEMAVGRALADAFSAGVCRREDVFVASKVAEKYGKTPAQVILRWALQRGTSVLPVSVREQRIRSNYALLDWRLSDCDWARINAIEPQIPLLGPCLGPAASLPNSASIGGRPETFQEEEEDVAGDDGDKGK